MSLRKNATAYYHRSVGFNAMGLGAILWVATVSLMAAQTAFLYRDRDEPQEGSDRLGPVAAAVLALTVATMLPVCADFSLNTPKHGWVGMLAIAMGSTAVLLQVVLLGSAVRGLTTERVLRFAFAVFVLQQASNSVQLAAIFNQGRFAPRGA